MLLEINTLLLNVDIPATTNSSKSVCPSTSNPPVLTSSCTNEEIPEALTLLRLPTKLISPVSVEIPATCKVVDLKLPKTVAPTAVVLIFSDPVWYKAV